MTRRRRTFWIVGIAVVAAVVVGWLVRSARIPIWTSIGCGYRTIRVTGRLIDADTRAPLAEAYVMTLPQRAWAHEPETIARYREWQADAPGRPMLCASAVTDSQGRFSVLVGDPISETTINGVVQNPISNEPRVGVEVLRIERRAGDAPIVVDVGGGTWQENPSKDVWAHWDLGDVSVPTAR